jgi:hypothetical protein
MPTISALHLALAIQAVDAKIADLDRTLDELPPDEGADLEPLLLSYMNAAKAMEREYRVAQAELSNLPAYESLVRPEE